MPQFQPGNTARLVHGGRSPRVQRAKRRRTGGRIRRELKANSKAWLERLIIALESRVASYHEYLAQEGAISARGQVRKCLEHCERDERRLVALHQLWEGHVSAGNHDLAEAFAEAAK
jgi:hypothetical protein